MSPCGAEYPRAFLFWARKRARPNPCNAPTPPREDEYDVNFVYGPDASNGDITKRHIEPLVKKALEGYNTCVYTFGATGALGWAVRVRKPTLPRESHRVIALFGATGVLGWTMWVGWRGMPCLREPPE